MNKYLNNIGKKAQKASLSLNSIDNNKKNSVLNEFNKYLQTNKKIIIKENAKDLAAAKLKKIRENLLDRLMLNNQRIDEIRNSIDKISKFKNPLGKTLSSWIRPNGIKIKKISIPIGVIGIIYESRPNVTCDVSSLCLKTGNVAILRGGSDSHCSNIILAKLFRQALKVKNVDQNCIQLIENKNKKLVNYLLSNMTEYIDVMVPRGGKNLVKKVQKLSKIPIIGHLEGVCHVYIHKDANLNMAIKILNNSKMRKTSICGAAETLLIDRGCLKTYCNPLLNHLSNLGCKIKGDKSIIKNFSGKITKTSNKDWSTEYLKPIISVKTVNGVDDAVDHINKYGTMHTDTIVTKNKYIASKFLNNVNSAIAIHNASTQFADGGEFGFGAEMGISTGKIHPRGPVGINQLTTYKYILLGEGQIRK